jgi:hypothetical protein
MKWSRNIRKSIRKQIVDEQKNKCANSLLNPSINLSDYKCLLWKYSDGTFDEAGFTIDHIDEYCKTKNSHKSNLQALCPNCHAVKTRRFQINKRKYTSSELANKSNINKLIRSKKLVSNKKKYTRRQLVNNKIKKKKKN